MTSLKGGNHNLEDALEKAIPDFLNKSFYSLYFLQKIYRKLQNDESNSFFGFLEVNEALTIRLPFNNPRFKKLEVDIHNFEEVYDHEMDIFSEFIKKHNGNNIEKYFNDEKLLLINKHSLFLNKIENVTDSIFNKLKELSKNYKIPFISISMLAIELICPLDNSIKLNNRSTNRIKSILSSSIRSYKVFKHDCNESNYAFTKRNYNIVIELSEIIYNYIIESLYVLFVIESTIYTLFIVKFGKKINLDIQKIFYEQTFWDKLEKDIKKLNIVDNILTCELINEIPYNLLESTILKSKNKDQLNLIFDLFFNYIRLPAVELLKLMVTHTINATKKLYDKTEHINNSMETQIGQDFISYTYDYEEGLDNKSSPVEYDIEQKSVEEESTDDDTSNNYAMLSSDDMSDNDEIINRNIHEDNYNEYDNCLIKDNYPSHDELLSLSYDITENITNKLFNGPLVEYEITGNKNHVIPYLFTIINNISNDIFDPVREKKTLSIYGKCARTIRRIHQKEGRKCSVTPLEYNEVTAVLQKNYENKTKRIPGKLTQNQLIKLLQDKHLVELRNQHNIKIKTSDGSLKASLKSLRDNGSIDCQIKNTVILYPEFKVSQLLEISKLISELKKKSKSGEFNH